MDIYQLFEGIARRDEAGANLPMPAFLSGLKVEVWASFATANGKDAATSSYLGAVQLS